MSCVCQLLNKRIYDDDEHRGPAVKHVLLITCTKWQNVLTLTVHYVYATSKRIRFLVAYMSDRRATDAF